MNVILNGTVKEIESARLSELVLELNLPEDGWAIAVNGSFVPEPEIMNVVLSDNDELDLVTAHPGG